MDVPFVNHHLQHYIRSTQLCVVTEIVRMKISLILLNGLCAGAIAVPTGSNTIHEKRDVSSGRWTKREAPDANAKVPVRIALKQKNLDKGMDYLLEV